MRDLSLRCLTRLLAAAAIVMALGAAPAPAQDSPAAPVDPKAFTQVITNWDSQLNGFEKTLADPDIDTAATDKIRTALQDIRTQAQAQIDQATSQADAQRQLLNALGPAPAAGAPAEAPEVTKQRAALTNDVSDLEGRAKRASLIQARADTLLNTSVEAARARVARQLLRQDTPPFTPGLWSDAGDILHDKLAQLAQGPSNWLNMPEVAARLRSSWPILALVVAAAIILSWPVRRWLVRIVDFSIEDPTYARKVAAAAALGASRGLIPVCAVGAVFLALLSERLLVGDIYPLALALLISSAAFFLITGLGRAALSPERPAWRLANLSEEAALRQGRLMNILASALALSSFVWTALDVRDPTETTPLAAALTLISNTAIVLLAWPLTNDAAWAPQPGESDSEDEAPKPVMPLFFKLRLLLKLLLIAVPVAAATGYYNMSDYILRNVLLLWLFSALFGLSRLLLSELVSTMLVADRGPLIRIRHAIGINGERSQVARFWISTVLDIVLLCLLALAYLPSLGVPPVEILNAVQNASEGVTIGTIKIVPGAILLAVAVFIILLRMTRGVQRVLESRLLPQTRLDAGVQNSVKSAIGYVGSIIAIAMSISVAGIDLSSIAIIAGALSVGIGFGLQNVVNNFISGLIVLIERPVKVGDWVQIGGHEGTVRRISVRATEIETFKRVSVIVPNGDLISQPIVNYTFKNKLGRIDIPVSVIGGKDTAELEKVLLSIVTSHKAVLSFPRPRLVFNAFSVASCDFELRLFLSNIEDGSSIRSELMFRIERELRAKDFLTAVVVPAPRFTDADLDHFAKVFGNGGGEAPPPAPSQPL